MAKRQHSPVERPTSSSVCFSIQVYVILSVSRTVHSAPHQDAQIREMLDRLEKNECIIEMPFSNETISMQDLSSYIKSELNSTKRNVTDSVLQALSKCIYQQIDKQSQIFFMLRLVFNESYLSYLSQRKKKLDLTDLNIDQILNIYTGNQSLVFNIDHCSSGLCLFQIIVNINLVQRSVLSYSITLARRNPRSTNWNCWTSCRATMNSS